MRDRRPSDGNRLSPQTLVVASLASLTAAIVTSTFWQKGTPITAALTPVIVALASELYSRPARRITQLSSRAATRSRRFDPVEQVARERAAIGGRSDWGDDVGHQPPPRIEEPRAGEIHVYRAGDRGANGGSWRKRIHPKVALVTAAIAFAIAAAVLTLPELVFGGSVASHGKTTFFGGGRHSSSSKKPEKTQTTPNTTDQTQSTPTATGTTPQQAPAQTAPQTTTPAPAPNGGTQTPAPNSAVPQGGGTTTPAPTP
jgi:hypothetical protein